MAEVELRGVGLKNWAEWLSDGGYAGHFSSRKHG